jgi:cell division protein FtsA
MSSHEKRSAVESRTLAPRSSTLAALDIGASKITCFIGSVGQGPGPVRVSGVGTQAARGVRNGAIVDLDAAERAVRAAVGQAERMAETTVSEVVVSVSGFGVRADQANGEISLHNAEIGIKERRKVVGAALQHVRLEGRSILHVTPSFFVVDGQRVRDPRGMFGKRLGVAITVVTAPTPQWRNIVLCVERAMYTISGSVAAPFAAALGALAEDDLDLGALVVDMGARSTTAALFQSGALVHVDAVPIGSDHVTHDIAHCLGTTAAAAERLKIVHGSAIASLNEDNMMIDVPRMTETGLVIADQAARSMLTGIVRPRVEETLELLRDRLRASGLDKLNAGRRIVLTGGGSQLNGVRELAARVFEGHVRIGRPQRFTGLGDAVAGPGYSVAAGLLRWGIERPIDTTGSPSQLREPPSHPVARAVAWLKENF